MLKDFEMICHHFPKNEDITILPVSDVHLGAAEHMQRAWELFCQSVLEKPNTYITLGGDLINNATKSSVSSVYDETMRPSEQKKLMAKMLEPLAKEGRILCAVPGNHERRSLKDADDEPMYDIMTKLDIEHLYRPTTAYMKIQIGNVDGHGTSNPTYCIAVNHGAGGGALTGSSVNRAERFGYAVDGLDCLILGHTHKPVQSQPGKIKVDAHNKRISIKPFKVVISSSWLSYGGYAAEKLLLPSTHAAQEIILRGNRKAIKLTMEDA
jgi:predicted MPP superfamily phosphohydrolase